MFRIRLLHLMFLTVSLLMSGCHKTVAPTVEERAKLMAEEIKSDQAECLKVRSKFVLETHAESDLHEHFREAQRLHCVHGDI